MPQATHGVAGLKSWSVWPEGHWKKAQLPLRPGGTKVPAGQAVQLVAGELSWSTKPAAQAVQTSEPLDTAWPIAQATQGVLATLSWSMVPAGQAGQGPAQPARIEFVPVAQRTQGVAGSQSWSVEPSGHVKHSKLPAAECVPLGQRWQGVAGDKSRSAVPAGQTKLLHVSLPAVPPVQAERGGAYVPIGHDTHGVDGNRSMSTVPAGHGKSEQSPTDPGGTYSPSAEQRMQKRFARFSAEPTKHAAQVRSDVAVPGRSSSFAAHLR
jgi:hypothetical protein